MNTEASFAIAGLGTRGPRGPSSLDRDDLLDILGILATFGPCNCIIVCKSVSVKEARPGFNCNLGRTGVETSEET